MPFAGHPTLGTAHVVRDLTGAGDAVTLEMKAGVIPVTAAGDRWTLSANAPRHRAPAASPADLAAMLGLAPSDIGGTPLWVDTGSEQLVIPLATADAVRRAAPTAQALRAHGSNGQRAMAYVFARDGDHVLARFFFPKHESVLEDPGHRVGVRQPGRLAAGDRCCAAAARSSSTRARPSTARAGSASKSPPTGRSGCPDAWSRSRAAP